MTEHENWLLARARATPNKEAVIYQNRVITNEDLLKSASSAASWLSNHGVGKDTKIGLMLPNVPEFIILIHALIQIRAVAVLINLRLTQKEIRRQLKLVNVDFLITSSSTYSQARELEFPHMFSIDEADGVPQIDFTSENNPISLTLDKEQTQSIVFTSGTTGIPKPVPLTIKNHYYSAVASAFRLGTLPSDTWLLAMPLYHLGGLAIIFRSCLYGTPIVLHPEFDEHAVANSLKTEEITLVSLVPTMLYRLLPLLHSKPKNLRLILMGGSKASNSLLQRSRDIALPVATTYGMTETSSQISTAQPKLVGRKPDSVGKPLLFVDIKIFDADENGVGEIGVRGPIVMNHYFNDIEDNPQFFRDSYFLTGDLGYVDEEGDLFVLQRRSDLIISGGENIYPAQIEFALIRIEGIEDACVIPLENEQWGQEPVAVLVLSQTLKSEQVVDQLQKQLARYKIPRKYFIIEKFPKTSSGKVARQQLIDGVVSGKIDPLM